MSPTPLLAGRVSADVAEEARRRVGGDVSDSVLVRLAVALASGMSLQAAREYATSLHPGGYRPRREKSDRGESDRG